MLSTGQVYTEYKVIKVIIRTLTEQLVGRSYSTVTKSVMSLEVHLAVELHTQTTVVDTFVN